MKLFFSIVAISFVVPLAIAKKECTCPLLNRPHTDDLELSARWMVHSMDWGVLSTFSSRMDSTPPFGNVYSFVDGPCDDSTGIPYFYASPMDQSVKDTNENSQVSFTLSEAEFSFTCGGHRLEECEISPDGGDPSNPMCARLTLTGKMVQLDKGGNEFDKVRKWLFQRHAAMKSWPEDHGWIIMKLEIEDIWFIDFFGGANVLEPEKYLNAKLDFKDLMDMSMSESNSMGGSDSHEESFFGWISFIIIVIVGSALGSYITATILKTSNESPYKRVQPDDATLEEQE